MYSLAKIYGVRWATMKNFIDRETELSWKDRTIKSWNERIEADNKQAPKKPTYEYPDLPEYTLRERLLMEREATGQYFSGHPLDEYRDHEATFSPTPIREILSAFAAADDAEAAETAEPAQSTEGQSAAFADKQTVTVAGAVAKRVNKQTRKGDPMAFVTLEDRFGEIEPVVFPNTLDPYGASLHPHGAVAVRGELSVKDEEPPKILVSEIVPLLPNEQFAKTPEKPAFGAARIQDGASPRKNQTPPAPMKTATVGKVFLNLPSLTEDCREYARVLSLLEVFPGPVPVVLHDASSGKYLATGSGGIAYSDAVHDALVLILGAKNVVVK